jgi:signal peptidase I
MTNLGPVHLQKTSNPAMREYAALGDNTTNSLDSRYWGPVKQFNIIGPASFALWPFTAHWGNIE